MPAAVVGFIAAPLVGLLGEGAAIAVASFALKTVGSFALSTALTSMSKKKTPYQERQAQVSTLSIGEVPRQAVFGIAATGGSLVDIFNWGGKYGTDRVTFCVALADHACDGMQGYFVGDEWHPWTGNGPQAAFGGKLVLEFRNASADGWEPPADAVAHGGWGPTDRGCGVAHIWVTWIADEKVWPQGLPQFRWAVRGMHPFDPRRGDHDPVDPGTWTFSRNPILERYTYTRGIYATGRHGAAEHLLIGRGLSSEEAPPSRIIGSANLCDEAVDGLSRYFADGVITANMDFVEVEELFATAMAGVIVQREGGIEIEPGQARATAVTITDDDLVIGEPIDFSEFRPDGDGGRINTVIPRYVSVVHGWRDHSGPVRRDYADIIADGGPRELTLSMPLVTGEALADRNAEIARRLARFEGRGGITLPPEFSRLEEGDWIAWTSERRFGGATRRFRVEAFALNEAWRNRLSLREIAASAFGETDRIADPVLPPPVPPVIDALTLPGAAAQAITLSGEASTVPAVRFTWDTPVDGAVLAVRGEVRIQGDTDASPTRFEDVAAGVGIATNGVAPDQIIQARLVPIGDPSRPVLPSPWFTLTTAEIAVGGLTPSGRDQLIADLRDQLSDTAAAERLAETLIQTILDEQESYELEAERRLDADTGVLNEATVRTAAGIAEAMSLVYTRAQTDAGLATTLQVARAYTDTYRSEAELLFSTKVERANGDAIAVLQARAYTDDFESRASLIYVTQTSFGSGLASTLTAAQSYTNGQISTALATTYTRAQIDGALATTVQQARSYTDALRSDASLIYATTSALGGVSATASLALSSAVTAGGTANATLGLALDVNGYVSGFRSVNTGTTSAFYVLADTFGIFAPSGGSRTEFVGGLWYAYPPDNAIRSVWGRPFGADNHGLNWWTGPSSVPLGGERKDNAYVYISMNTVGGPRFGGSDVPGGTTPLSALASNTDPIGHEYSGDVTTGAVTVAVSGTGAGSATIRWVRTGGDDITATSPNAFTTQFTGSINPGQTKQAVFLGVVVSGTQAAPPVVITATLASTA